MGTIFKNKKMIGGLTKTVGALLVVTLLAPSVFFAFPQKAEAAVPVAEVPGVPNHIFNTIQNWLGSTIKELGLDTVAWMIAKQLIHTIASDLISWINSGFNGAPAFVQDLQGFMVNAADKALGQFLEGTSLAFLCDAFKLNISISLQLGFSPIQDRTTCRLSDAVGNIQNFLSGDFLEGGFAGIMHMTMIPLNNIYGSYLLEEEALAIKIATNVTTEQKKLDFGKGFLSWSTEECASPDPDDIDTCHPVTHTPGTVIEAQLEHTLGTGIRQLEIADEFDEVVAALMSQLLNQMLSAGLSALGGGGGGGSGGTSFIGRLRTAPQGQAAVRPNAQNQGFAIPGGLTSFVPPEPFSFTISSPGIVSVAPGGFATIPITKTLQTGTAASVSLTIPSRPSVVTNSALGADPCTPTCTSNVIFTISPTAALGQYFATIGTSPPASNGTISVQINVTNAPDIVPPTIRFGAFRPSTPLPGTTLTVPVTFSDNVGIANIEVRFENVTIDGIPQTQLATVSPRDFIFDVTTFSEGTPLRFTAIAIDTSGNQTTVTKTGFITGDTVTPP